MKSVEEIIEEFGGLTVFRHVRLECEDFMPLVIEAVGPGQRGLPMVSVTHYYTQNGDAMRDPEMTFEVRPDGEFHPVSYLQDSLVQGQVRSCPRVLELSKCSMHPPLAAEGKKALLLVWDNAPWHISRRVRAWLKAHNRRAKQEGGVRILVCPLPIKAPWLNPIEPKWAHGKRAIVEPERKLTAQETKERVGEHYHCQLLEPLEQKVG